MFPKPSRVRDRALLDAVKLQPCSACGSRWNVDPHHVTTRGAGGGDEHDNVMPLCRQHHTEWDSVGVLKMVERYPGVLFWLRLAGRMDVINKAQERTGK